MAEEKGKLLARIYTKLWEPGIDEFTEIFLEEGELKIKNRVNHFVVRSFPVSEERIYSLISMLRKILWVNNQEHIRYGLKIVKEDREIEIYQKVEQDKDGKLTLEIQNGVYYAKVTVDKHSAIQPLYNFVKGIHNFPEIIYRRDLNGDLQAY